MSPQPASPDNSHSSLWKLFRTSTFRLSALYLVVFILSAIGIAWVDRMTMATGKGH